MTAILTGRFNFCFHFGSTGIFSGTRRRLGSHPGQHVGPGVTAADHPLAHQQHPRRRKRKPNDSLIEEFNLVDGIKVETQIVDGECRREKQKRESGAYHQERQQPEIVAPPLESEPAACFPSSLLTSSPSTCAFTIFLSVLLRLPWAEVVLRHTVRPSTRASPAKPVVFANSIFDSSVSELVSRPPARNSMPIKSLESFSCGTKPYGRAGHCLEARPNSNPADVRSEGNTLRPGFVDAHLQPASKTR